MSAGLRLMLVGPLPPPSGGMANQTRQLKRLLEQEGIQVSVVQTNAPYRPAWIAPLRGLRALFRFVPFVGCLLTQARKADVVHVMANSGWAWHLLAAPAILISKWRGKPVLVNYRGGLAHEFLASDAASVRRTLSKADALVVPSRFLQKVFEGHGVPAEIVPNIVDTATFRPLPVAQRAVNGWHIVVARNLEKIYGNDLAIRAFAVLRHAYPSARLSIAGSGPELESLQSLARTLDVESSVRFTGRLEVADMVALYQQADLVLNPSRADNTPNSILEALACGIPVVSSNVGGVPFLVEHGRTAWLVPPESPDHLAAGMDRVLRDSELRHALVSNGLELARECSWPVVRERWLSVYQELARIGVGSARRKGSER
jgi:glycosyltransferase involved in cell wall biosynthesis